MNIKYIFSPHAEKNKFIDIYEKYNIVTIPYYIYPSNSNFQKIQVPDNLPK